MPATRRVIPCALRALAGALLLPLAAHADPILSARVVATIPEPGAVITNIVALPSDPDSLWITTRSGRLYRFLIAAAELRGPIATFPVFDSGECGLIGLAFHPGFASNGLFYIHRSITASPSRINTISEFRCNPADPDSIPLDSERPIMTLGPAAAHNGGWMDFDPSGMLRIAVGENNVPDHAQDRASLLGKILRINVDADDFPADPARNYAIPADNPFSPPDAPEVFMLGLRNPWRCSFDRATGDFWIADVGESTAGEIDHVPADAPAGLNFGWPCVEGVTPRSSTGPCADPGALAAPLAFLDDEAGSIALTGGYVYRGADLPLSTGLYLFGDLSSTRLFAASPASPDAPGFRIIGRLPTGVTAFGQDARGELYAGGVPGADLLLIACGADFNRDGFMDFFDYDAFVQAFTEGPADDADVNGDGFTDFFDYDAFVESFEKGC